MILVLGESGSGKTSLLKLLSDHQSEKTTTANYNEIPMTVKTIGTNIVHISGEKLSTKSQQLTLTVQEIGGAMKSLWAEYLRNDSVRKVLYVIDIANSWNYSIDCINLIEICKQLADQRKRSMIPLIIAINKTDCEMNSMVSDVMEHFLMINDLIAEFNDRIQFNVIEISCVTHRNLHELLKCLK